MVDIKRFSGILVLAGLLMGASFSNAQIYENLKPAGIYVHPDDIFFPSSQLHGDYLFLLGHDYESLNEESGYYHETITVLNISNPASPSLQGEYKFSTHYLTTIGDRHIQYFGVKDMMIYASYTHVLADSSVDHEIRIINFTSPSNPYVFKTFDNLQLKSDVFYQSGDSLYTANGILNISASDTLTFSEYPLYRTFNDINERFAVSLEKKNGSNPYTMDDDSTTISLYALVDGVPDTLASEITLSNQLRSLEILNDSTIALTGLSGSQSDGYTGYLTLLSVSNNLNLELKYADKLEFSTTPTIACTGNMLFLHAKKTIAYDILDLANPIECGFYYAPAGAYVGARVGNDEYVFCSEDNQVIAMHYEEGFSGVKEAGDIHLPNRFSITRLYPNPFNGQLNLDIEIQSNDVIRLELFNLLGQKAYSQEVASLTIGNHTISINTPERLASGMYLLRAQDSRGTAVSRRVVLLR